MTIIALLDRGAAESREQAVLARNRRRVVGRLVARLDADGAPAQFARFVLVGGVANLFYGLVFVLVDGLAGLGDQPANVAGTVVSSVVANELHRRLTFRAGRQVSWLTAQWEAGAVTVAALLASGAALGWLDSDVAGAGLPTRLVLVAAVSAAVGLFRFAALRWLFIPRARRP